MDPFSLPVAILGLSILLQLTAAMVALHHIRLTGRAAGWVCFAAAVSLMAVRRGITLTRYLSSDGASLPDPAAEAVALAISVLMLLAIMWLGNLLQARNIAERERREYEERFGAAFRLAPSMIMLSALDNGEILEVNDAFESITGHKASSVLGRSAPSIGIWRNPSLHSILATRLQENGSIAPTECELIDDSGRELTVLLSGERLGLSARPIGLWQAIDITERKKTERELSAYRTELEELVEKRTRSLEHSMAQIAHNAHLVSIGTLAAGIAHQINNPLGSILAATQYAIICDGDDSERGVWRSALETIEEETVRCSHIVRSVLQFSREDSGERWSEDLRNIAHRAIATTSGYASRRSSSIEFRDSDELAMAVMSPIEIEQVIVNVLRNAIESRETGTRVRVVAGSTLKSVWITISDNGAGIPESDLSRLFDPFFTTRLGQGGTGLGLSVAHGIVAAHGGSIVVDSKRGVGTEIRIVLPKQSAEA